MTMWIELAVQLGWRVRRRDWPPLHYVELRMLPDGHLGLSRVLADGLSEPWDQPLDEMCAERGWSIVDAAPARAG